MELRAQGLPLVKIADEIKVSKTTLINWSNEFREEIDNLRAVELEATYDKYDLSVRKKVEFFGDVLSRIQRELETRDLSSIPTEKLFATLSSQPLTMPHNVQGESSPFFEMHASPSSKR